MPSLISDCARRVAVVVPSPATSFVFVATSLTSCAPMFSNGSSRSISFAIVTPSFVMSGAPYFLSSTTLRPFGPSVILTVSASWSTPLIRAFLASSPYIICLAIVVIPPHSLIYFKMKTGRIISLLQGYRFDGQSCNLRRQVLLLFLNICW